jgi:hypothetical protein
MAEGLVDMSQQFGNLPMESLIGGPLQAAAKANAQMVMTNAQFIIDTGFQKDENGNPTKANMVEFAFEQNIAQTAEDGTVTMVPQEVKVKAPMLAILPLPALKVKEAEVTFSMQVNSSTEDTSESSSEASIDGSGSVGWGPFKVSVKVHGKTSSHSSQTRKSDNSAKYDVHVLATDDGIPEGLARILDMMQDAITPTAAAPVTS